FSHPRPSLATNAAKRAAFAQPNGSPRKRQRSGQRKKQKKNELRRSFKNTTNSRRPARSARVKPTGLTARPARQQPRQPGWPAVLRQRAPGRIRTDHQETLHFSCSATELQARVVGLRGIEPPDLPDDASAARDALPLS